MTTTDALSSLRRPSVEIRDEATQRYVRQLIHEFPEAYMHRAMLREVGCDFSYASRDAESGSWSAVAELNQQVQRLLGLSVGILAYYSPHRDLQTRTVERMRTLDLPRKVDRHLYLLFSRDPLARKKIDDWTIKESYSIVLLPRNGDPADLISETLQEIVRQFSRRNPYERTSPVTGDEFYGRQTVLRQLVEELRHGHVCGVFGLRKTGKTSLITELGRQFVSDDPGNRVYVLRDLEVLPSDAHLQITQLVRDLAAQLQLAFRRAGMRTHELAQLPPAPSIGELRLAIQASLVHETGRSKTVVLALDEVESLIGPDATRTTSKPEVPEFLGAMRSLVQENPNFNVVMSGITVAPLTQSTLYGRENPLFAWAKPIFVTSLPADEASKMIDSLGGRMALRWKPAAIEVVLAATGGQVFLTRSLAGAVAGAMSDSLQHRTVGVDDVKRQLRPWRRSAAALVDSMLDALARFYPAELAALQLGVEVESFEEVEQDHPGEVDRLVSLGLLIDDGDQLNLAKWAQLGTTLRRPA